MLSLTLAFLAFTATGPDAAQEESSDVPGPDTIVNASREDQDRGRLIRIRGRYYEPNDIVCKRERVTGSRVKKKLCNTARDWELMEINGQDIGRDMQEGIDNVQRGN